MSQKSTIPKSSGPELAALRKDIEGAFDKMSPQLKKAARYVLDQPDDVGLLSMRRLAAIVNVQPATMTRLAQYLGFDGYAQLQEPFQARLRGRGANYSARARSLQARNHQSTSGVAGLLNDIARADAENLEDLFRQNSAELIADFCARLLAAPHIFVIGLRGSFPIAYAFRYTYNFFRSNSVLLDGLGGTFADELRRLRAGDVVFAIGFSPYTDGTIRAIDYATNRGATLLALTDSRVSPLAQAADLCLVANDDGPSVFQSCVAPLAMVQALVAVLVSRAGDGALADIAQSEKQLNSFDAYSNAEGPVGRAHRARRFTD